MAWRVEHVHLALPIGRLKASLAQLNGEPARLLRGVRIDEEGEAEGALPERRRLFLRTSEGARVSSAARDQELSDEGALSCVHMIKFWTYGKSGGATFRKRQNK